jgi:hypothetical protein
MTNGAADEYSYDLVPEGDASLLAAVRSRPDLEPTVATINAALEAKGSGWHLGDAGTSAAAVR